MSIRTRFAPSPTGFLHIGGARTALFCWLFAKKMQGTFILRIEDTDLERSTKESVAAIFDGMKWLQLEADEGPFYQTERFARYREVISQLLANDLAYRCDCSKERLDDLREAQMARKEKPRYDGFCRHRHLTEQKPFVVRFKNPNDGAVTFNDLVRGELSFNNDELDDLIIARTDGSPTYNFTVVVDDWDMKITHVIRGDDHINNTPRQINILNALRATIPQYAHVPMILGSDGKRLSKRHGAVSVMQYREEGFLPEALLNYLVRLGWSHGDQEIFSIDEMIKFFDIRAINRAPAAFNLDKLLWLNQHYLKNSPLASVARELAWHFTQLKIDTSSGPSLEEIIKLQCERTKTLREMAERSRYFFEEIVLTEEAEAHFTKENAVALLALRDRLKNLSIWTKENIHQTLLTTAESFQLKLGKLAQPLRVALTGGTVSPPIDATMVLFGQSRVLSRLDQLFSLPKINAYIS